MDRFSALGQRQPGLRAPRVLIVDDDPMVCELLAELFEVAGATVECRTDGGEVHAVLWDFDPDLLIIDVVLPHTPGAEVVRHLRASEGATRLPVVMISGSAGSRVELSAMRAGADHFLRKPFQLDELYAVAKRLLDARAAQH